MQIFRKLLRSVKDLAQRSPSSAPDPQSTWPETGRKVFRVPFLPDPTSVLAHLKASFDPVLAIHWTDDLGTDLPPALQTEVDRHLRFYSVGLEALLFSLPREEMPPREAILGEVCKLLATQLESCPPLLRHGGIVTYLDLLTRDMTRCGSESLAEAAGGLRKQIDLHLFRLERPPLECPDTPGELTREGVFRVLLDECHRDGTVDEEESAALAGVARLLDIGPVRQEEMAAAARARFEARELPPGGAMDPSDLMDRLHQVAEADGVVTDAEKALLDAIGYFLRVGDELEEDAESSAASEGPGEADGAGGEG